MPLLKASSRGFPFVERAFAVSTYASERMRKTLTISNTTTQQYQTTSTITASLEATEGVPGVDSIKQSDGTYLLTAPLTVVINGEVGSSVQFDVTSTPIG